MATYHFEEEIESIRIDIESYKRKGLSLFSTSSFQPQSTPLLHIISQIDPSIPIYFLNTGYHFPETLRFRTTFAEKYGLKVIDLFSSVPKIQQRDGQGNMLFTSDPDYCCYLNKVEPLEKILLEKDVWINGIRKGQNANRSRMQKEEKAQHGVLRYHPILEWTSKMIFTYMSRYGLPDHPLMTKGYFSIGCEPCTRRVEQNADLDDRSGRWAGMTKTECGLHTDLVLK
jgi:phosphoadenosine phosphosulfate reductase